MQPKREPNAVAALQALIALALQALIALDDFGLNLTFAQGQHAQHANQGSTPRGAWQHVPSTPSTPSTRKARQGAPRQPGSTSPLATRAPPPAPPAHGSVREGGCLSVLRLQRRRRPAGAERRRTRPAPQQCSPSTMSQVETFATATRVLFDPRSNQADRQAASGWLVGFQRSVGAWQVGNVGSISGLGRPFPSQTDEIQRVWYQVCFSVLSDDAQSQEAHLVAGQTIRQKMLRQLSTIAVEQWPSLRDQLVAMLQSKQGYMQQLAVQLALSLASLIIQWPEWEDVPQYLGKARLVLAGP